ncbi:jg16337 [Pararge aegeria aegeria]|uniref:Jg16337 protein n=1 Tax=Pararge aegeria aegeria TaxID=348720 RepID=A0A8S4RVN6_9NEOP|nr:jg16337 [Pararge aegeria aegeria]
MAAEGNYGNLQFTLSNGVKMPAVGLGTYRIRNNEVLYKAVDCALEAGYRLFDTAAVYHNEQYLGNALRELLPKYGLTRQDIYITTKLSPSDLGGSNVAKAFNTSLENLSLDYIDLYLIHFPGASKIPAQSSKNAELRIETWNEITKLYDQGKVKAIGVSNFTVRHLTELAKATAVEPMLNQVEWHPHYYQPLLLQYCNDHKIRLQAYCSFGGLAISNSSLMEDPVVVDIAQKYNATSAQILLAWALHQGIAVIPKSTTEHRIKENIQLNFKLTTEDISQINTLGSINCKYSWDPTPIA